MGNLGTFIKGAPLSKADITDEGTPFVLYGELYTTYGEVTHSIKRRTDKVVEPQFYSKVGDVIMPTSGETPEDIATASCIMLPDVILAGDLLIYRTQKVDGRLVSFVVKNKVNKQISSVAQGKSVVHVRAEELSKISISYPSDAEQQKILAMLELLDDKITKQRELIEHLKKYKRGLLSYVFKDCSSWKVKPLGSLCRIRTGKLDANAMVADGIYPFFTCARESYKIDTYAFDCDALLISGNGANVGYIHHYCGKFNAYQRTYVLDGFDENINYIHYFLEAFLSSRIDSEKKAGNTPYIVLGTLSEMEIFIPSMEIQENIAKMLASIDQRINLEELYYSHLTAIHKGIMQSIFI